MANKQVRLNNAAGFSLVELMVVVAIIGILASVAVPQFQKFTFKARLTEAKAGLTSLYTAEKAFYGEWSQFDTRFQVIGYAPEGNYSFNIGFTGNAGNARSSSFQTASGLALAANPPGLIHHEVQDFCAAGGVNAGRCKTLATVTPAVSRGAVNVANGDFAAAGCLVDNSLIPPKFTACAEATPQINPEQTAVNLVINQSKDLRSTAQ